MQTLRIDGYIGKDDGMSVLFGQENFSLKKLVTFLDALPKDTKELKVEINSGGGSVTEGFAIHDKLASSGLTIHTEVLGLCGSIATVIALSAKKENRSMHANSEYFIHNPFWQPMAPDALEAEDLQKLADELRSSEEKILNFYADKTGQGADELQSFMDRATSFSADEAKKLGFVSNIIGEAVNERKYRIAAFVERAPKEKTNHMEFSPTQKSWIEQKFNDFTAKFDKYFKPVFNMFVDLESGGKIWVEGELVAGSKVFNVDAEGKQTTEPTADGDYKTTDGKTIAVKEGAILDVKEETAPSEVDALKAQVAELTAKLSAETEAKAQAETSLNTEKEKFTTEITALKTEVTKFKNMVLGNDMPGKDRQDFPGGGNQTAKTPAEKLREFDAKKKTK